MLLGDGISQEIEIWERNLIRSRLVERRLMNPKKMRIWREGYDGVWRQNGVWDLDEKSRVHLLRPHHFAEVDGKAVDFSRDFVRPFINRYAAGIRQVHPDALIFIETDPRMPPPPWGPQDAQNIVYAPHWYDSTVLFLKTFSPWIGFDVHANRVVFGRRNVQRSFAFQLGKHKEYAARCLGSVPTFIGEIGIAFDLNGRLAYRTGNFSQQIHAMDRTLRAADENMLSYALWNYTPDHDNTHGDQWNGEDLSIFSREMARFSGKMNGRVQHAVTPAAGLENIHLGGRALEAIVRPYPRATAGEPLHLSYDIHRRVFTYEFRRDPTVQAPTEIFLPQYVYPGGCQVWLSDGECEINEADQTLLYRPSPQRDIHRIRISPKNGKH
jgi:hypothetical protein